MFKPGSLSLQLDSLPAGDWYRQARRGNCAARQADHRQHKQGKGSEPGTMHNLHVHSHRYRSPEARLIESARMTVLNTKDSKPCTNASRRILCELTWTSETWQVIPITKEKWAWARKPRSSSFGICTRVGL